MREIRLSGSEGGVAFGLSLPLSKKGGHSARSWTAVAPAAAFRPRVLHRYRLGAFEERREE